MFVLTKVLENLVNKLNISNKNKRKNILYLYCLKIIKSFLSYAHLYIVI